mmetsp:Transcript_8620/g.14573  ORF Transcript_8620/g.14573 Transcript_8620/m.14573 type:complete len:110 (+) Transcript_8620:175-504(+)
MRKRMMLLIPYNLTIIWATLKYCANIKTIAARFWPNFQKVRVPNLILISTVQAMMFTSIYIGGTFAILGINPIKRARELKAESQNPPSLEALPLIGENGEDLTVNLTKR